VLDVLRDLRCLSRARRTGWIRTFGSAIPASRLVSAVVETGDLRLKGWGTGLT
jgi:hypothetical protein